MKNHTIIPAIIAAFVLPAIFTGCSTHPIVSRKGVSGMAAGEVVLRTAALGLFTVGQGAPKGYDVTPSDRSGRTYILGVVPVRVEPDERSENSTQLYVNKRNHGCLPIVTPLEGAGPHRITITVAAFQPWTTVLAKPIVLNVRGRQINAWPPLIVEWFSGAVYTIRDGGKLDSDLGVDDGKIASLREIAGRAPLLIGTTTGKHHAEWRKLGELKPKLGNGGN
ncbi:MAG: hypothetical protein RL088_1121 [Verrucomicrobiota bacterium]|jgi:hypothetical protein